MQVHCVHLLKMVTQQMSNDAYFLDPPEKFREIKKNKGP